MRAYIDFKSRLVDRRELFSEGLKAVGIDVVGRPEPAPGNLFVTWNRYGFGAHTADSYERAGGVALIVENGYLGKRWLGEDWFALSLGQHNGAGRWRVGGDERWDSLGVDLSPWRFGGSEVVVLPQRGIGPAGVAMPRNWPASSFGRVRVHPGTRACVALEDDLKRASSVVTWGSGAALKALLLGIPVFYAMPLWIGAAAGLHVSKIPCEPLRDDFARLSMFRKLAWAMWTAKEIELGVPFRWLLCSSESL